MPIEKYRYDGFFDYDNDKYNKQAIPALFKGYTRVGARFTPYPAIDNEFGSIDFFTIFNRESITGRYARFLER